MGGIEESNGYAFRQFAAKFDYRGQVSSLYGMMIARDNLANQVADYDSRIATARSELPQEILTLFEKELIAERLAK